MTASVYIPVALDCDIRFGCSMGGDEGMLLRLGMGGGGITVEINTTKSRIICNVGWTISCSVVEITCNNTDQVYCSSSSSSSSLGSRCVPWFGEGLSMSSPNDPVLCCPLPDSVTPLFVQVVFPPIGWSPLSSFIVVWSPSSDT